jgi:hypothetical protein
MSCDRLPPTAVRMNHEAVIRDSSEQQLVAVYVDTWIYIFL